MLVSTRRTSLDRSRAGRLYVLLWYYGVHPADGCGDASRIYAMVIIRLKHRGSLSQRCHTKSRRAAAVFIATEQQQRTVQARDPDRRSWSIPSAIQTRKKKPFSRQYVVSVASTPCVPSVPCPRPSHGEAIMCVRVPCQLVDEFIASSSPA